jgi:hypothetical protein
MDENRIDVNRARLPADPVNAFGIPQPLLICLDVGILSTFPFFLQY